MRLEEFNAKDVGIVLEQEVDGSILVVLTDLDTDREIYAGLGDTLKEALVSLIEQLP
jgi:hypothetical protein